MKSRPTTIALALVLLCATMAWAQTNSGEIKGFVTDEEGNYLKDATVRVTSDSLMGERVTTSGVRGYYILINLPPGKYKVSITKENYISQVTENISVRAEKVTNLNVKMKVGNFEQTITITGDVPIIDPEASGQKFQIAGEFQTSLPLNERRDYHEILRMIPGVVNTYNIDAVYAYYKVHGADPYSGNIWMVDGASSTSWSSGYAGSSIINTDIIDDASIQVSGLSASSPMGQGATVNMVTKSGGNEISGSATLQLQPKKWNDKNIEGGTPANQDFTQTSFTLGGPILTDKLWFFGSYRYTEIIQGLARTEKVIADMKAFFPGWEPFDLDKKIHMYFLKATYALNTDNQFFVSYQREWGPETFGGGNRTVKALIDEGHGGPLMQANWITTLDDNLSLTSSVSFREKPRYRKGRGAETDPAIIVYNTWYQSGENYYGSGELAYDGNYRSIYQESIESWEVRSDANYYLEDFYGSHEMEFGVYAQPNSTYQILNDYQRNPDFEYKVPIDSKDYSKGLRTFAKVFYDADFQENTKLIGRNYAAYINDTWKPNSRMTINAGLRFDHVGNSDEIGGNVEDVASYDEVAPVIGMTYMVTEDGKNILRGSYRKSMSAFRSGLLSSSGQAQRIGYYTDYDIDGDGVFEKRVSVPPSVTAASSPDYSNRSLPYSNDFNVGYTRELPFGITASLDYTYRQFKNQFYSLNTNPIYQNGQFVGMRDPAVSAIYEYTNNTWNWVEYHGVDFQVNKRLANNLQFMGSVSHEWQELKGDWAPDDPFKYISSDKFAAYGQGNGYNATGGGQGPNFRFNAVWNTPWYGIIGSISTIHMKGGLSGPVYEILTATNPEVTRFGPQYMYQNGLRITNPLFNTYRLAFDTRKDGQWRAPMNHKINIRIGKEFRFMERYRAEIALDVFNIFNWDSFRYTHYSGRNINAVDSTGAKYYGTNYSNQAPRAAQLFVRFAF